MATPTRHDSMVNPRIEALLDASRTPPGTHGDDDPRPSKFTLVTLGATRARQINAYYNKLSDGTGGIPPQVASVARKPLSIAFEEIAAGKIVPTFEPEEDPDAVEGDEQTDVAADGSDATS